MRPVVTKEDPEFAYLTTTGRKSGEPHTVELWYRRLDDVVVFIGGDYGKHPDGRPDWIHNLLVDPTASVRIGEQTHAGNGRLLEYADAQAAREAMAARYQNWSPGEPLSDWAANGHVVAVDLRDE